MPFSDIFCDGLGSCPVVSLPTGDFQLDIEFIPLARELIDDFVEQENAVWVQIGEDVKDPDEPWKVTRGTSVEYAVKIVFLQDTLEDRQLLRYLKKTEVDTGNVNGIMYSYGFEPSLKDIVKWNGRELAINNVDPISPVDEVIIYMIEFAV